MVIPCSTLCKPSVDSLHNLSEACNSFQESHRKEISEFNSLIQVVSCAEILRWSFHERINYFSFDLCVCVCVFRICRFVFSAFRLGTFGTNLYILVNLMGVVLIV